MASGPRLVHKQFNSPIGLYSQQNIQETLNRHVNQLNNGAIGIDFNDPVTSKTGNLANSSVLRLLEEEEERQRRQNNPSLKKVVWPPEQEVNGHHQQPAQTKGYQPQEAPGPVYYNHPINVENGRSPTQATSYPSYELNNNTDSYRNNGFAPSNYAVCEGKVQSPAAITRLIPVDRPNQNYHPVEQPRSAYQQPRSVEPPKSYQPRSVVEPKSYGCTYQQPRSVEPPKSYGSTNQQPKSYGSTYQQPRSVEQPKSYSSTYQTPKPITEPNPYGPSYQPELPKTPQQNRAYNTLPNRPWNQRGAPVKAYQPLQINSSPVSPQQFSPQAAVSPRAISPRGWAPVHSPVSNPAAPPVYYNQPQYEPQSTQYNQAPLSPIAQPYRPEAPPTVITLRQSAPVHQRPAAVYTSQPATTTFQGGVNMRGDQKWPPQPVKDAVEAENEARKDLARGPTCRPRKVKKDYTHFFAQNALNQTYPAYRAPPGTQHYEDHSGQTQF